MPKVASSVIAPRGQRRAAVLRSVLGPLYRGILALEVEGQERIPVAGPCILVFNHLSNLDPHLLLTILRRPKVTGLVAASYRSRPFHRWMLETGGGIWLRRGAGDRGALEAALKLLQEGWLVGLAPEGRRSPDGTLKTGRPGVAFLALRSGAPILPVGIQGTDRVVSNLLRGRRTRVTVRVGSPFRPTPAPFLQGRALREAVTKEVMTRIGRLLPQRCRSLPHPPSPIPRAAGGLS